MTTTATKGEKIKFKKFLAMLLSIIMVFGTLPAAVFAEGTQVVKTQYVKVNGTDEIVPGRVT